MYPRSVSSINIFYCLCTHGVGLQFLPTLAIACPLTSPSFVCAEYVYSGSVSPEYVCPESVCVSRVSLCVHGLCVQDLCVKDPRI